MKIRFDVDDEDEDDCEDVENYANTQETLMSRLGPRNNGLLPTPNMNLMRGIWQHFYLMFI